VRVEGVDAVYYAEEVDIKDLMKVSIIRPIALQSYSRVEVKEVEPEMEGSQMIFPKLEKESPAASIHHSSPLAASETAEVEEMDEFDDDFGEEEHDDETEDGFMTDEEYDILDASDEEYLVEQGKSIRK